MKLKYILTKYKYYIFISYILTIIGIIISYYFHPPYLETPIYWSLILLSSSCIILDIIGTTIFKIDKETKKEYIKINFTKLNIYYPMKTGSIKSFIKYKKIIGMIGLVVVPILTGIFYYISYYSIERYSYLLLITVSFQMTLYYTSLIREQIFRINKIPQIYILLGLVILLIIIIIPQGLDLLNKILFYIFNNLQNSFTILIAIIMLCIGLSALTFGYCAILDEKDEIRKKMKRNGEGYFIASILSIIAIITLFITSIMKNHVKFMALTKLNIFSYDFLLLNLYSTYLIIIFILISYSSYCLIKCSILALIELNCFEEFI